jgi:hypothetical protein
MLSTKLFRFIKTLHILTAALTVCGLQMYAQRPDPRTPLSVAARAAAARSLAGRATDSPRAAAAIALPQTPGTFITFDVPGAAAFIGTFGISINPAGEITGIYSDASFTARFFKRATDGSLTTFDVPNDINGCLCFGSPDINPAGKITANFADANGTSHGFLRARDGSFVTFDAPGAGGSGFFNGTFPTGIDPAGNITGNFTDASGGNHGFLRISNGAFTTFDAPGGLGSTFPISINPGGVIAGIYGGTGFFTPNHGFLREPDGTFTTFAPPGSVGGLNNGAPPLGINTEGDIAGSYFDANLVAHGFLRAHNGSLTFFDAPGAGIGSFQGTYPNGIDPAGNITGSYSDANGLPHGFRLARDAIFTTFDAPGAVNSAGCGFPGTTPSSINQSGDITGFYSDANCGVHGFLLKKNSH